MFLRFDMTRGAQRCVALLLALVGCWAPPLNGAGQRAPLQLAPYGPTPQDVVERMLKLAQVTASDVLYDLGSGDGRIVITAARTYGARGIGVDIEPDLVSLARENARKAGLEALVRFEVADAMTTDLRDATVVTLYLLPTGTVALRPRLTAQLRPGARIVSHIAGLGDWEPTRRIEFVDAQGTKRTLSLWIADGKPRP